MKPPGQNPPELTPALRRASAAVERAESALRNFRGDALSGTYVRDSLIGGFWSPEVFEIFGLDRTETAPPLHVWATRLPRADFVRVTTAAQHAFWQRQPFDAEYNVRSRNGAHKILRSRALPVGGRFGRDFALAGIVTDITAEHHVRAALQDAAEELHRAFGAIGAPTSEPGPDGHSPSVAENGWKMARGGMSPFLMRRIVRLIEESLPAGMTVAEMARAAGLSVPWFSRVFKQVTGETPHQFLLRQRLQRARAALLNDSEKTIAAIAIESGFFDQAHLTRHFRRHYGTTPGSVLKQFAATRRP
jgi:AraC-like DNA-binding protein